jgi:hypothetical protein
MFPPPAIVNLNMEIHQYSMITRSSNGTIDPTLSNPNITTAMGVFYLAVILATYMFQYVSIIRIKKVDGINAIFLTLGNIAAICSMCNAIVFYFDAIKMCGIIPSQICFNNVSGLLQFIMTFICMFIFQCIFIYYYVRNNYEKIIQGSPVIDLEQNMITNHHLNWIDLVKRFTKNKSICLFVLCIIFDLFLVLLIVGLMSMSDWTGNTIGLVQQFARALGYFSVGAVGFQYIPQIYTVWILKQHGALSFIMLILMAVGNAFSVCYFLFQGISDYTTWLPFAVCFVLLVILIGEIIYFKVLRNRGSNVRIMVESEEYEVTHPLIQSMTATLQVLPSVQNSLVASGIIMSNSEFRDTVGGSFNAPYEIMEE